MEYGGRSTTEHRIVWFGIFAIVALMVAFVVYSFWPSATAATSISVGPKTFYAEVADTDELREVGLREHAALGDDQAMLLVYPADDVWVLETDEVDFPVDMVWITHDKKVAYVAKNTPPNSSKLYRPGGKARYVLQLPAGSVAKYGIAPGKMIEFEYRGDAS